ncbi:Emp24/gp25L/p24 family protein [Teladorsagia circumcincta]|uniref:Emp24/gp25L/p24 family protein n=1 Tax=Teladorsagia circumcincta TaxID=45464 RepID=A0A2G9UHT2_TELCI|nr:Emp24/gp25L/p24 family protein [Teladorsagia circumcincta]
MTIDECKKERDLRNKARELNDSEFNGKKVYVVYKGKILKVYPTFRITTEFHPEFGTVECREDGEYTFTFDNSHGKIWSKEVSYKISLI